MFYSYSVFTVDDAVNKVGFGKFQIKLIFLAGFGWVSMHLKFTHFFYYYISVKKQFGLILYLEMLRQKLVMIIFKCYF